MLPSLDAQLALPYRAPRPATQHPVWFRSADNKSCVHSQTLPLMSHARRTDSLRIGEDGSLCPCLVLCCRGLPGRSNAPSHG